MTGLVVTGGRDFREAWIVDAALDALHDKHGITLLAHGGARGADTLAGAWALRRRVPAHVFEADWNRHGKAAGHIRNGRMLDNMRGAVAVVAFKGGKGTADCVWQAHRRAFLVLRVVVDDGGNVSLVEDAP